MALMYFKAQAGILPSFQPFENFQAAAGYLFGRDIHPQVLWLLSFINGSSVVGLAFGYLYRYLPGPGGASKGLAFGLCGWLLMNTLAFPLVGLGLFANATGLGPMAGIIFAGYALDLQSYHGDRLRCA